MNTFGGGGEIGGGLAKMLLYVVFYCSLFPYLMKLLYKKIVVVYVISYSSSGGIIFFYLCFYAGLAALFAVCMQGLFYTLNTNLPRWQQGQGLIGDNPGVGFRPIADDVENVGSLVWYNAHVNSSIFGWTKRIEEFLEPYNQTHNNQDVCDFDKKPGEGKVCNVDLSKFGNCTIENEFGFRNSAPCFFVKLNRIIGWEPNYYDDPEHLPEEMPADLKEHIASLPMQERKVVWVSCAGENPADRDNIGPLWYGPVRGWPGYYYPYTNLPNYLSPLVAVQLRRPQPNVLINIECRAWAPNIYYSKVKNERQGSVHLEVMVD